MTRKTFARRSKRTLALFFALVTLAGLTPFQPAAEAADAFSGKTKLVLWSYVDNMDEYGDSIRDGDRLMMVDAGNVTLPIFTGTENSYDGAGHSYNGTNLRDASRRPTTVGKNIVESVIHGYNFVTDSGLNTPFLEQGSRRTPPEALMRYVTTLASKAHDTIPTWRLYLSNSSDKKTSAGLSNLNNSLGRVYTSLGQSNSPWYICSSPYDKVNTESKQALKEGLGSVGGSASVDRFHTVAQVSDILQGTGFSSGLKSVMFMNTLLGTSRFFSGDQNSFANTLLAQGKGATMICYVGHEYDCDVLRSYTVPKDSTQVIGSNFCYIPQNEVLRVASGGLLSVSGVIFNDGRIIIEPGGLLVMKEGATIMPLNPMNPGGGITSGGNIVMRKNALLCGGGTNGIYLSGGSVVNYGMLVSENFNIANPHTVDNREGGYVITGKSLGPKGRGTPVNIIQKADTLAMLRQQREFQVSLNDEQWVNYYTDMWYDLHPVWYETLVVEKPKKKWYEWVKDAVVTVICPPAGALALAQDIMTEVVGNKTYYTIEHRIAPEIPEQSEVLEKLDAKIENCENNRAPDAPWGYPDGFGGDASNFDRWQKSAVVRLAENAVFNNAAGLIDYGSFSDGDYSASTVRVSVSTDGGSSYAEYWSAQLSDVSYAQTAQPTTYSMLDLWKQDSSIWAKYEKYGGEADAMALADMQKQGYGETVNLRDAQFYVSGYPAITIPGNWYMKVELGSEVLLPGEMAAKVASIRKIPAAKVTDSTKDPMEQYNFEIAYMYQGKDSGFVLDVDATGGGYMEEGRSVQIWSRRQYDKNGNMITDITDPDQIAVKQNDNQQWRLVRAGTGTRDDIEDLPYYYIKSSPSGMVITLDPSTGFFIQKKIAEPADDNQLFYLIPQEADMEFFLAPKSAEEGEYLGVVQPNKDGSRPQLASIWDINGANAEEKRKNGISRWFTFRFNLIENGFTASKTENLDGQVFEIEQYRSNENNKVLQVEGGSTQTQSGGASLGTYHLKENVRLNVYQRTGKENQQFRFQEASRERLDDGSERVYYYISSYASDYLMTAVVDGSATVVRQTALGAAQAADLQLWYVERDDSGSLSRIVCKYDGKALAADSSGYASTASGGDRWRLNTVLVGTEKEDKLQAYTFQIGLNGSSGLTLEVEGGSTEAGANLVLNTPDGTAKQEFSLEQAGTAELNGVQRPYYYIQSTVSENVMEASGGGVSQGVHRSFPDDSQLWYLVPRLGQDEYSIVSKSDGQYLTASGGSGVALSASPTSSWVLTKTTVKDSEEMKTGVFQFEYLWTEDGADNRVMDVSGGTSTDHLKEGQQVFLYAPHGGGNQQWRLEKAGTGKAAGVLASYYYIINSASGLALTYESGKIVQRKKTDDNAGQQWYMIPQETEGVYMIMQKADQDRYLGALSNQDRAELVRAAGSDITGAAKGCRWRLNAVKNPIRETPEAESLHERLFTIHSYRAATGYSIVNVLDVDGESLNDGARIITHEAKMQSMAANQQWLFEKAGSDSYTGEERPYFFIYGYQSRKVLTLDPSGNYLYQSAKELTDTGDPAKENQLWYIIPDETGVFCSIVSRWTYDGNYHILKDAGTYKNVTAVTVRDSELKTDSSCLWRLNPVTLESEAIANIEEYGFLVEPYPSHWGLSVREFGSGDSVDVELETSTGGPDQQFHFVKAGEETLNGTRRPYYYVKANQSKQVWTVDDRGWVRLAPVEEYNENQLWMPIARITPGEVYLLNLGTRKYLTFNRAGRGGALKVEPEEYEKRAWVLSPLSVGRQDDLDGGVFTFTNLYAENNNLAEKTLTRNGGESVEHLKAGMSVVLYNYDLRSNQQWRLEKAEDGKYNGKNAPLYYIVLHPSGCVLAQTTADSGSIGVERKQDGSDRQLWYMIPGDDPGEYRAVSKASGKVLIRTSTVFTAKETTPSASSLWRLDAVEEKDRFVPSALPEDVLEKAQNNNQAVYHIEVYSQSVLPNNKYLNIAGGNSSAFMEEGQNVTASAYTGDVNQQFQFEYAGTDTVDGVQRPYYYVRPYYYKNSVQADVCLTADTDNAVRQFAKRTPVDRNQQWYLIPDEDNGNFIYLRSRKNVAGGEARYLTIDDSGLARVVQFNPNKVPVMNRAAPLRLFFIAYPLKVSKNPDAAKEAVSTGGADSGGGSNSGGTDSGSGGSDLSSIWQAVDEGAVAVPSGADSGNGISSVWQAGDVYAAAVPVG